MSQDPLPSFGAPGPLGALCAQHPQHPASSSCPRCGNFMCAACTGEGQWARCPACRQQEGTLDFPFSREAWTFSGLWEHCASLFKPHWLLLSVATVIALLSSFASQIVSSILAVIMDAIGIPQAVTFMILLAVGLAVSVVQLAVSLGFIRVCLDVLEGRGVVLSRLFSQFGRIVSLVLMAIVIATVGAIVAMVPMGVGAGIGYAMGNQAGLAVGIGLGLLVAMVPILLMSLVGYLGMVGLVVHPETGPIDQLSHAWWILRGQKLAASGVLTVVGLVMLGGALLCGVGFIPAYAFGMLLITALYLALDNGEQRGSPESF